MENKSLNPLPVDKGAVIRTTILAVALINQLLVSAGYSPLPIDDANIELWLSTGFTAVAALITWWKDQNITRKARQAAKIAKQRGLK